MSQMTLRASLRGWADNERSSNGHFHDRQDATRFQPVTTPWSQCAGRRSRHVLLLDEGWAQTIELASGLENAGCRVTVVTAQGGTACYRHRAVHWRLIRQVQILAPHTPLQSAQPGPNRG